MMVVRAGPSIPMVHGTLSIDSSDFKLWEPRNYLKLESQRHSKLSLTSWVTDISPAPWYFFWKVPSPPAMPVTLCHPRIFIPESDEKNGTGFPQLIPCFESRQISWVLQHLDGTFFQHLAGPISIFCCLDYLWPSVFNRHYMVCFIHFSYGSSAEFLILRPCFLVTKPLPPTVGLDPPRWHPFSQPWWREWYHSAVEHRGVSQGSVEPDPAVSTTLLKNWG